jgi:hypothetical protein
MHSTQMDTTSPRILLLSLDRQPFFDDMYERLIDTLVSKATIQRASKPTAALNYLSTTTPTRIVVTSGRKCPSASDYCYSKMDVVETSRGRLVGRSQKCMGRAYTSISIGVDNMTGCLPNRAIEFSLPIVPTAFYPFCASSK